MTYNKKPLFTISFKKLTAKQKKDLYSTLTDYHEDLIYIMNNLDPNDQEEYTWCKENLEDKEYLLNLLDKNLSIDTQYWLNKMISLLECNAGLIADRVTRIMLRKDKTGSKI